jgi:hypothetical protein
MQREEYLALRRPYEPESASLVIVAESPPASGKYFYNSAGSSSEPLFAALMKQLQYSPESKESGLREFQRRGWILVDATYEPVDKLTTGRDEVVVRDYHLLRDDLGKFANDRLTPLILIKANVCRLLEPRLLEDGFNVLNRQRVIYFPSSGQQTKFHQQFSAVLASGSRT